MKCANFSLILFATVCFLQDVNGARILGLFPTNLLSHSTMFNEVMKSLADKGHQVDVVSHFPQKQTYPNYKDIVSLAGTIPNFINNMSLGNMDQTSYSPMRFLADVFGNKPCALLGHPGLQELIKNPPTNPPYDLVVAEYFFAHCYFAFGRHLKVPLVGLTSSRIVPQSNEALGNPVDSAFVFEIEGGSNPGMSFRKRFENTIITSLMIYEAKYYMEVQNDVVRKYFGPGMPDIRELEKDVSLLLVNSHHSLNGPRPLTPAIIEVGGLHVRNEKSELSAELETWLDQNEDGFVYVSFGSMMKVESFPRNIIAQFYSAFTRISPIRVLMKVASPEDLPPGLPENVFTLTWAPQITILQHGNIRAFVTHGGLLGVVEAVTFAVPIIGIPLFGDQFLNIDDCVKYNVGVSLDFRKLTADMLVEAVNSVVYDPQYKKNMIAFSAKFLDRPTSPRETAVFWIEYILKHGSDILRSPATKLKWWQLALLDVYGSVIVTALLVLWIVKRIFFGIFRRIIYTNESLLKSKKKV